MSFEEIATGILLVAVLLIVLLLIIPPGTDIEPQKQDEREDG
jgi:hypothetical protein